MAGLFEWLGEVGATLLAMLLPIALGVGALYVGAKVHGATKSNWKALAVGVVTFILLVGLFGPALDAMKRTACQSADDVHECVEGFSGGE